MIEVYAMLFFTMFVRQSTTSPPQNLNEWVFFIVVLLLLQTGGGAVIWAILKSRNDVWQAKQVAAIAEEKTKADIEAARAKADSDEGSAIASALVPLISQNGQTLELFGRVTQLSAEANSLLKSHAEMMKNFNEEQIKARALWHSSMESKMSDLEESIVNRAIGDTETLAGIRTDIAAVKSDLDEKADKILKTLDDKPSVQGHQEATKQITDLLTEIKSRLASIEARLPVAEPPKADGPALAATSMTAPTGLPKESEKPQ